MALVVFLRGVNVGGHKAFQPTVLARQLAALDVKSLGAAGTFVVSGKQGARAVRAEFAKYLPFEARLMVCPASELLDLLADDPFADRALTAEITRYVSVLEKPVRSAPKLPIRVPEGKDWQVEVMAIRGPFVMSLHRRQGKTLVYPNAVVEKKLGVAATTRNWKTLLSIGKVLGR
jgi:uncharacterized protein (DUF1697 family)